METLINKRVKIKCPVHKGGRTLYGIVTGVKNITTYFVLIDGNVRKSTFASRWLTPVE